MNNGTKDIPKDTKMVQDNAITPLLDQIGQLSQIDLNLLLEDDGSLDMSKVEEHVGRRGVGSIFNNINDGKLHNASDYRQMIKTIQNVAFKHNHPPILFGLDSIHGANYVGGATIFPQALNLAATFNPKFSEQVGEVASRDTRAAGFSWIFAPLLGIGVEPRWSRLYETFGEDGLVVERMARAMIRGIQMEGSKGTPARAAACAKHFVGYSKPRNGNDRAPSHIARRELYEYFVPPWRHILNSNDRPWTLMEDYNQVDGVPTVANQELLTYLLRYRLQYTGMAVTDYSEIYNLDEWHHTASNKIDAIRQSYGKSDGVDMSMIPFDVAIFQTAIETLEKDGKISRERINKSAQRILDLKQNILQLTHDMPLEDPNLPKVGSDRTEALQMAKESITLCQNQDDVLPIASATANVLVTGPTSHSLAYQSGGWTWQWQGASDDTWFSYGTTLFEAAQQHKNWTVTHSCGIDVLGNDCSDNGNSITDAVEAARTSDMVLIAAGEENYAEKPGDLPDGSMALPQGQVDLVKALATNSETVKVLVYFGGRPRWLKEMQPYVDAIIVAFLPGPDGGEAVLDIITGQTNPSARLPITYPSEESSLPYNHAISQRCTSGTGPLPHWEYTSSCPVQWPFGHGLSYSIFDYSDFTISGFELWYWGVGQIPDPAKPSYLDISMTVTNTGNIAGKETVLLFRFDKYREGVTPEYKRLQDFAKTSDLQPGESEIITFRIASHDLKSIGPEDDSHAIYVEREFWLGIGPHTDCRVDERNELCHPDSIHFRSGLDYQGVCDVACGIWQQQSCHASWDCWRDCQTARQKQEAWGWDYVDCLEHVLISNADTAECWKLTTYCRDIFHHHLSGNETSEIGVMIFLVVSASLVALLWVRRKMQKNKKPSHHQLVPDYDDCNVDGGIALQKFTIL